MERITTAELPQGLIDVMRQVQAYINNSGLDKRLRTLVNMRVSQMNGCAFCLDMHYKEGIQAGETPLRLVAVSAWKEMPYYTPRERAVLAFAESLTRMPDEEYTSRLHEDLLPYFSKQEIAHLTLAIAQINSWNRLMRSFGREPGSQV